MKKKDNETRTWPGFWEGTNPVVNFKTESQKLKFAFLQRPDNDYITVFHTGEEMIQYLDDSPFTEEKFLYEPAQYYNWPIKKGQVLALQHDIMRTFN